MTLEKGKSAESKELAEEYAEGYLYIEPVGKASAQPVIDNITRKMAGSLCAAYVRKPEPGRSGFHTCVCGVSSDNRDLRLSDGKLTNSLCVHYLAFHRKEVPESEIKKVMALSDREWELSKPIPPELLHSPH